MQDNKMIYQSKTVWVNLIFAIAAFFPSVQQYISSHPELIPTVFAILNILLRIVTKSGVQVL